ncbi:MAG: hypothetical protein H6585_14895 [Flavobacteriales bacterium]|nr:hypothetical protein [Flavobacteriales bacterium]
MLILISVMCLTSCIQVKEPDSGAKPFFDIPAYFNAEIAHLTSTQQKVNKRITLDDRTESEQELNINWKLEFHVFTECDLNVPALRDAYRTDSSGTSGNLIISYHAKDNDTKVREVSITFENNQVTSIRIELITSSNLYSLKRELSYTPGSGYHMEGERQVPGLDPSHYMIDATFQ